MSEAAFQIGQSVENKEGSFASTNLNTSEFVGNIGSVVDIFGRRPVGLLLLSPNLSRNTRPPYTRYLLTALSVCFTKIG